MAPEQGDPLAMKIAEMMEDYDPEDLEEGG